MKTSENIGQALALYAHLGDMLAPEMSMALNRAAFGVRTDVNRKLAAQTNLTQDEIDEFCKWTFHRSKEDDLVAHAIIKGKRIPLEELSPSPSTIMGGKTSGGVTVNLLGKSGTFKHAFIGKIFGDAPRRSRVWLRQSHKTPKVDYVEKYNAKKRRREKIWIKHRFPVANMTARSIPQVADDAEVVESVIKGADKRVSKQFVHRVHRLVEDYS